MNYIVQKIPFTNYVFESPVYYEADLVKDWFNLAPGTILYTTASEEITIISTGVHNRHEGPDIQNAILIINGKVEKGQIECHVNTSDWFKHGHQKNEVYQNVLLHVVRRNCASRPSIPTVILKPSKQSFSRCSITNYNKNSDLIKSIQYYSHNRWLTRINLYSGYHNDKKQLGTLLINNSLRIIGAGGNKEQFLTLAKNINYDKFDILHSSEHEKYLWDLSTQLGIKWVKCGIRPAHQPQNRMKLAAELIQFISNIELGELPNDNTISLLLSQECSSLKGKGIKTELLGNILIPFFAARALYFNMIEEYIKYFATWNNLYLPYAYQKYKNQFKRMLQEKQLRSFSILQGLIEIDNNWCSKKLCHLCPLQVNNNVYSK